ncbi:hypothetical protein [Sinobaca sp. H24]|uniref:hypothetical protein n=1 Tax=Sinobaca sp. H24 TaxID=2923376 RepID=UPI00207A8CDE|nr:hypothetical protein [Sinobaca sp. H24]
MFRPAVNPGISVSRVGGSAQIKAMKKVAGTLRLDLAAFRELEAFSQFGSDLDESTQAKLNRGARTVEMLKQDLNKPLRVKKQVAIIYALTQGYLDDVPVTDIQRFESELMATSMRKKKRFLMVSVKPETFLKKKTLTVQSKDSNVHLILQSNIR